MHDNRMTTTQTSVFGLPVNMSLKRTFTQLWCCNLLHGREGVGSRVENKQAGHPHQNNIRSRQFCPL
jgi:hypothetical protein